MDTVYWWLAAAFLLCLLLVAVHKYKSGHSRQPDAPEQKEPPPVQEAEPTPVEEAEPAIVEVAAPVPDEPAAVEVAAPMPDEPAAVQTDEDSGPPQTEPVIPEFLRFANMTAIPQLPPEPRKQPSTLNFMQQWTLEAASKGKLIVPVPTGEKSNAITPTHFYMQLRTVAALVCAGFLEYTPDGYRLTPEGRSALQTLPQKG